MSARQLSFAAVVMAAVVIAGGACAQTAGRPDLTGSWERYRGPAGDPANPPPEAQRRL